MTGGRVVIPKRHRGNKNPLSTSETVPSRSVSELALTEQVRRDAAAVVALHCGAETADVLAILGLERELQVTA